VAWLVGINRSRLSLTHGAKTAMPRANVASEHEGGRAIRPAFKNIRAARFLADRVKVQALDQLQHVVLIRRVAQTNF
jgi:hypothetical protein